MDDSSVSNIVKCEVGARAASDFAADKDGKYNGAGFMSHLVCYDITIIDFPEDRKSTATQLFQPNDTLLSSKEVSYLNQFLFDITLCNYDLSKVSEEVKKDSYRNVQECHLDKLIAFISSRHSAKRPSKNTVSMSALNCSFGFASEGSMPDGVVKDGDGFVRMVFEVKHNVTK